mmetsp:Transcript_24245/g.46027  ORF Transcript_24245/g.46027 Transcript_24245/m.46027 type:complete len:472 (-) Transcript_24245:17-1432(-)
MLQQVHAMAPAAADWTLGSNAPKPQRSHPGRKKQDPQAIKAARAGDLVALQSMSTDEVSTSVDHNGCNCLHWAAGNGDLRMCELLVSSVGVDVHSLTWNQRTPLHYAARNGQIAVCKWLADTAGACVNAEARDEVSPFQLAVWQNHLDTCSWLVEAGVNPLQRNRFGCSVGHWLALSPRERAGPQGESLIPLAQWLKEKGVDFSATQEHGHTALHKAAWSGHLSLCMWLRDACGLRDSLQDEAGNYAADLADMTSHESVAAWLRSSCSEARRVSCRVLGVADDADSTAMRAAYLQRIRAVHPDSCRRESTGLDDFIELHSAYRHLVVEGGRGSQCNPRHVHYPMLTDLDYENPVLHERAANSDALDATQLFKARLLAVIREFGTKGFPLSILRRKYSQVWAGSELPKPVDFGIKRKCGLLEMLKIVASDVVRVEMLHDGHEPLLHLIGSAAMAAASPPPLNRVQNTSRCEE